MSRCKVLIGYPSQDKVHVGFMNSICEMITAIHTIPFPKQIGLISYQLMNARGSLLPKMRQDILDRAIRENFTHLLFVDSDQTFPKHILHRWLFLDKPIIAANVVTKEIPANPTARVFMDDVLYGIATTKEKADNKAVEQIDVIGTGVMLINIAAIKDIPRPHFSMVWDNKREQYIGEDWFFCSLLTKCNIPIYIDHAVSWAVGHLGQYKYTHELVALQQHAEGIRADTLQGDIGNEQRSGTTNT